MGLGWVINDDTKIIWHDGSTDNFDCFIGFEKHSKKGVVVLSNYPNKGEINAAKIGLEKITELVRIVNREERKTYLPQALGSRAASSLEVDKVFLFLLRFYLALESSWKIAV